MVVFEAPEQTAKAILSKYQESFLKNNTEFDEDWLKLAEKKPKEAMEELDWWMRDDFELLSKMAKAIQEGKIPEGASEWLVNQVIPLELFGTYEATQNPPSGRQNLIWPEDQPRALETFNWYMTNRKQSDVQNRMRERFPGRNIKNPLEFSIWDMEDVEASLTPEAEAEARNERWMPSEMGMKPSQADVAYNEADIMIVKVTGAKAASKYASGTKWCTSNLNTAQSYLNRGPLYVVFRNGQKYGQIHTQDNAIMDLQDRPIRDLPPAVATFMVSADRDHLRELLDNWPNKEDIIKELRERNRRDYQSQKTEAENRLAKALGIYEGNNVDEDSYSRFFMKRLYGNVDTADIRRDIAEAQESLDGVDDEEIQQYQIDGATNNKYNDLNNTLKGLNNMVKRVASGDRKKLQLISADDLQTVQDKLKEVNRELDFDSIDAIVATLPATDAIKKLNRDRVVQALNSWGVDRYMRDSLDFVVRSSGGYDIESFDPQLYQILRSYVLSGDGARDSDVTIPFPDGDVLKSMLQKKKGSQLQAFPLWFLKQEPSYIQASLNRLESESDFMTMLSAISHSRTTTDPDDVNETDYDRTSLMGLSVLPEPIREIFIDTLVRGIQTGQITDEEVGNNYQTRNWGNVANLSNAIIALAATMGTQKEQQVANRLKSGATDLTVRQRAKRWLNDHYFNTQSRESTAYTTQPLFTDKGYKLLNSDSNMTKIKDASGYYLRVTKANGEKLGIFGDSWQNRFPDRFDLKPYRDSEGEDINPFMPMIDLDDGGDEFGDLKEEILLGVDDPNVGLSPNASGDVATYLHVYVEPFVGEERMVKQANAKGMVRPPAYIGWGCVCCGLPIEYDADTKTWQTPEGVNAKDSEFGERWDWDVRYDVEDNGILPQNSCVAMDTAGKNIIFEESGGYNRSGLKIKLPLVKQGQRPHLVPGIAASSLWCTKCYGWRPVGQEVRNSYSTLSREWEILRALRPCKCGYTKASVALYEAESIDYEPTEAEITAEITGALGSGGPRGLNQTAYEAEGSSSTWYSAKFSDGDIELTLVALVPDDEEDIPAYIWEMGESAEGDYVDYEGGDDWSYVHDSLSVHRDIKEAEYTRISGDDMEDYLTDMGFEELPRVPRRERIYQKLYGRGPDGAELFTRVYTSIVDGAVSGARDVGRDAIRVVPIYIHPTLGEFALAKNRRVHRVLGWRKNLADRIQTSEDSAPGPVLDSNGKPMRLRKNRRTGQHFWGSIDYPKNMETRPYRG